MVEQVFIAHEAYSRGQFGKLSIPCQERAKRDISLIFQEFDEAKPLRNRMAHRRRRDNLKFRLKGFQVRGVMRRIVQIRDAGKIEVAPVPQ